MRDTNALKKLRKNVESGYQASKPDSLISLALLGAWHTAPPLGSNKRAKNMHVGRPACYDMESDDAERTDLGNKGIA